MSDRLELEDIVIDTECFEVTQLCGHVTKWRTKLSIDRDALVELLFATPCQACVEADEQKYADEYSDSER